MKTLIPQTRRLSSRSGVDPEWLRALFDFMDFKPRSAIYSMAFALTCIRTYDLSERNMKKRSELVAEFEAARELLDLLDDNINGTDALNASDLRRGRAFDTLEFARSNDLYVTSFDEKFIPIARYGQAITTTVTADDNAAAAAAVATATIELDGSRDNDSGGGRRNDDRNEYVAREILNVLERVNEQASIAGLRVPANARCSISVERVNLSPLNELLGRFRSIDNGGGDDATAAVQLRNVLRQRIVASMPAPSMQKTAAAVSSGGVAYTYLEAYVAYAPMIYRYESLRALISRWNEQRRSTVNDNNNNNNNSFAFDDEAIRWILLPTRGVWQSGTSQILWLVLHTLTALTVQRRNCYVHRTVALLERLSFYVWCAECSMHWQRNRGDDYFRHIGSLPNATLNKLPIDIILLRCHNTVNANSSAPIANIRNYGNDSSATTAAGVLLDDRDGFASKWTLANLCIDYRDFATIGLLRLGDRDSVRSYRAALCRPMVRSIERINGTDTITDITTTYDDEEHYLLSTALSDSGIGRYNGAGKSTTTATTTIQNLLLDALKQQHGEMLLRKLWHDVDPSTTVPICAMY